MNDSWEKVNVETKKIEKGDSNTVENFAKILVRIRAACLGHYPRIPGILPWHCSRLLAGLRQ